MPRHPSRYRRKHGLAGLYWQKKFGASPDMVNNLSSQIGNVESSNQNLDYQAVNSETGVVKRRDLGKGYFQMEVGFFTTKSGKKKGKGFQTAVQRYINLISDEDKLNLGKKAVPKWVYDAKKSDDPSTLERWQQEELMLSYLAMNKGSDDVIKESLKTGDFKELWLKHWYAGDKQDAKSLQWDRNLKDHEFTYNRDLKFRMMQSYDNPLKSRI